MSQHGRCTECGKWFTPKATAAAHQRVCGAECRDRRRLKLARRRRRRSVDAQRTDERLRQRKHRDATKDAFNDRPSTWCLRAHSLSTSPDLATATRHARASFSFTTLRIIDTAHLRSRRLRGRELRVIPVSLMGHPPTIYTMKGKSGARHSLTFSWTDVHAVTVTKQ